MAIVTQANWAQRAIIMSRASLFWPLLQDLILIMANHPHAKAFVNCQLCQFETSSAAPDGRWKVKLSVSHGSTIAWQIAATQTSCFGGRLPGSSVAWSPIKRPHMIATSGELACSAHSATSNTLVKFRS